MLYPGHSLLHWPSVLWSVGYDGQETAKAQGHGHLSPYNCKLPRNMLMHRGTESLTTRVVHLCVRHLVSPGQLPTLAPGRVYR
jgi:hypothetical protein